MFDIRVVRSMTGAEAASRGGDALGQITVGDFSEQFSMSLWYWSPEDYESHWLAALAQVDSSPDATSCLISSVTHPTESHFAFC